MASRESAKRLVKLLEKFPDDRIPHFASFKASQVERFRVIAGMPLEKQNIKVNSKSITDIVVDSLSLKPKKLEYKKELYSQKILDQQWSSAKNIGDNKYLNEYKISEKLLKPKGNPRYYDRLNDNIISGTTKKENFFSALKTIITGKH